jgi:hypothetical protein
MLVKVLLKWFPLACLVAAMSLLGYILSQQVLRQTANDPQIQLSEDTANALSAGQDPKALVPSQQVDLASSLSPFIIVYNDAGQPLVSSGQLGGVAPQLPSGLFDVVRLHHQDRVTWQPRPDVRDAIVITRYESAKGSGFVLAGRSLREVEVRENQIFSLAVLGGGTTAIGLLILIFGIMQVKMLLRSDIKTTGKRRHAR